MKRWKLVLGIIMLFLSGAVCGAAGTAFVVHKKIQAWRAEEHAERSARIMKRLDRAVGLSDEQRQEIRPIIEHSQQRAADIRRSAMPEARRLFEETLGQVEEKLTPDQQQRLRRRLQKMKTPWLRQQGSR